MLKEQYKAKLIRAIHYHYPAAKIYLFGSRARGTNEPTADIDLAIDTGEKISHREIYKILQTIDNLNIPYEVDVVDINSVPEDLRNNILFEGVLWTT